jgi:FAD/FMN-containing dehydrogenase
MDRQLIKNICVYAFICTVCGFFSLNGENRQASPSNFKLFKNVVSYQNALSLMECIPPELQNLPYAIYPTNPEYNIARFNYNKRFSYCPKAIFNPTTFEEVQYVFGVLKRYHLPFAVRSGRHCLEPGSLSNDYIIDLQNFNSIIPDVENEQVYIGAGCQLGNVINTLGQIDYAIPSGTCPSVGITGLTLGGGIGLLGATYGLTCDSVKSITFLNADSQIVEVNASNYPDLFWALLGGGNGSYGIVLGFTFQMYYIPEATFYELMWEYDYNKIPRIMQAWQAWAQTLPSNISSVLGIRHPQELAAEPHNSPPLIIRVFGLKVGSEPFDEWVSAFQDLNPQVLIFQGRYIDTAKFWVTESQLPFNKWKSCILQKPLKKKEAKRVKNFFRCLEERNPDYLVYFNFEALGGVIPANDTAFFPRDAFGWWQQAYYWEHREQDEEILALSREFYSTIPPKITKYCYANIVDYDLGSCYLKKYYGNHVRRLIKIKDKYDPNNLFHWKQSIPTSDQVLKQ